MLEGPINQTIILPASHVDAGVGVGGAEGMRPGFDEAGAEDQSYPMTSEGKRGQAPRSEKLK